MIQFQCERCGKPADEGAAACGCGGRVVKLCPDCGMKNSPAKRYCDRCGSEFPSPPASPSLERPRTAILGIFRTGPAPSKVPPPAPAAKPKVAPKPAPAKPSPAPAKRESPREKAPASSSASPTLLLWALTVLLITLAVVRYGPQGCQSPSSDAQEAQ